MKFYSQKDSRWKHHKLGTCRDTIYKSGCKLCCISSFTNKTPPEVNGILKKRNGYTQGCLIADKHVADILGIDFNGKMYKLPSAQLYPLIAEVRVGSIQHFVIMTDYNHIADPLDNPIRVKKNKYKIISYRLYKSKNTSMKQYHIDNKLVKVLQELNKNFDGDKEKDHEKMAKKLEDLFEVHADTLKSYNNLSENYSKSLGLINKQRTDIQLLNKTVDAKKEGMIMQRKIIDGLEDEIKKLKKEFNSELLYKLKLGKLLIVIRKVLQV